VIGPVRGSNSYYYLTAYGKDDRPLYILLLEYNNFILKCDNAARRAGQCGGEGVGRSSKDRVRRNYTQTAYIQVDAITPTDAIPSSET